jgi:hypothetical protein
MQNFYKPGVWNAVCDVCGFKHKSDQLTKRWDGKMVCKADFETRHPADLFRAPIESSSIVWSRREVETYLTSNLTTYAGDPLVTENGDNLVW